MVVLDMPLLDTRQGRDLTGTLIADIVLQLLSYVAQTEREFIRQRQAEGIAAAKAKGLNLGRRPKEKPESFSSVYSNWQSGAISARRAAIQLGTSHSTFLKWARETWDIQDTEDILMADEEKTYEFIEEEMGINNIGNFLGKYNSYLLYILLSSEYIKITTSLLFTYPFSITFSVILFIASSKEIFVKLLVIISLASSFKAITLLTFPFPVKLIVGELELSA